MAQRWQRVTASSSRNLAAPAPALQLVTPPSTLSSPLPLSWFNFHVALGQLCPFVLFKRVRVFPSLRRRPTPRERERERDFPTWVHRGLSATSGAPPYLSTIGSGSFSAPHWMQPSHEVTVTSISHPSIVSHRGLLTIVLPTFSLAATFSHEACAQVHILIRTIVLSSRCLTHYNTSTQSWPVYSQKE